MQIAIPIYDAFTALDAIGPYDVFAAVTGWEVTFCAAEKGEVRTENMMLGTTADAALEDIPEPDIVVVPGGMGNRKLLDPGSPYIEWLAAVHPQTTWTTSVCTGSLLLAAAGLLDGLSATTHWAARDQLERLGASPVAQRVVEHPDQRIITAAGVSAGIDMALGLVDRIKGETAAQEVQLAIEYDPDPPHDTGSAEKAPAELVENVRAAMSAQDERLARLRD